MILDSDRGKPPPIISCKNRQAPLTLLLNTPNYNWELNPVENLPAHCYRLMLVKHLECVPMDPVNSPSSSNSNPKRSPDEARIPASILAEIASAPDPAQSFTYILEWTDPIREIPHPPEVTRREFYGELTAEYAAIKAPLLKALSKLPGVEVENLSASDKAIIKAPATQWSELLSPGGIIYETESVKVLRGDVMFEALEGSSG